jgi:hypothetical protein
LWSLLGVVGGYRDCRRRAETPARRRRRAPRLTDDRAERTHDVKKGASR